MKQISHEDTSQIIVVIWNAGRWKQIECNVNRTGEGKENDRKEGEHEKGQ